MKNDILRIEKKGKEVIMPGKHDPRKKFVSFSIERELFFKMTQYAAEHGLTRTDVAVGVLQSEMDRLGVKLTPENKAKLEAEINAERARRKMSWSRS